MRYTLSSVLNRLSEVERKILSLYRELSNKVEDARLKRFFTQNIEDTEKRVDDIGWIKNFIIVEMTLEPIIGPDLNEFYLSIEEVLKNKVDIDLCRKAESIRTDMYRTVIEMIENISPEAADMVRNFMERSMEMLSIL